MAITRKIKTKPNPSEATKVESKEEAVVTKKVVKPTRKNNKKEEPVVESKEEVKETKKATKATKPKTETKSNSKTKKEESSVESKKEVKETKKTTKVTKATPKANSTKKNEKNDKIIKPTLFGKKEKTVSFDLDKEEGNIIKKNDITSLLYNRLKENHGLDLDTLKITNLIIDEYQNIIKDIFERRKTLIFLGKQFKKNVVTGRILNSPLAEGKAYFIKPHTEIRYNYVVDKNEDKISIAGTIDDKGNFITEDGLIITQNDIKKMNNEYKQTETFKLITSSSKLEDVEENDEEDSVDEEIVENENVEDSVEEAEDSEDDEEIDEEDFDDEDIDIDVDDIED